jgi:hypothetical protein
MSKKGAKKGRPAPTRQQQQQAAAARRRPSGAASRTGTPPDPTGRLAASGQPPVTTALQVRRDGPARHYLDVSAVRIQEWLARTPDLKFRRGASVMLSEATGHDAWPDEQLPPGMHWNTEAGDLDGVVSVIADQALPEAEVAACLAGAAREIGQVLRRSLPHCPIQAVTGTGDSYAAAYQAMEQRRRDGDFVLDAPPPPAEVVLAKPCDQCRDAAAEHADIEIVGREKREDLCTECADRVKAAGGTKGSWEGRSPRPERRMKAALRAAGMDDALFPDDFSQLAEAGRRAEDDAATQLALIYADGNRVGAFLSEAAAHARRHGTPAKADIVPALDTATVAALADAIIRCFPSGQRTPVLAHVAGGDDLLVSVPAGYAWPFARGLLTAFGERVAAAADWPAPVRTRLPSMSAGVVFHHLSAPFPDVVRLARDQLAAAKACTQGTAPSVAFLDLTADGDQPPASRRPLPLAELDEMSVLLTAIAAIPSSHRQTLVALQRLAEETGAAAAGGSRGETPADALARRVTDLGYQPLWEAVAGPAAGAPDVREELRSSPAARSALRGVLDLARWWPPPEPAAQGAALRRGNGSGAIRQEVRA